MIYISSKGFEALSEISRDLGQIFFASVFLEPLVSGQLNWFIIIFGMLMALVNFGISFYLAEQSY